MSYVNRIKNCLTGRCPWNYHLSIAEKLTYDSEDNHAEYFFGGNLLITSIVKERTLLVGPTDKSVLSDQRIRRKINNVLISMNVPFAITSKRKVIYWSDGKKYNGPRVLSF